MRYVMTFKIKLITIDYVLRTRKQMKDGITNNKKYYFKKTNERWYNGKKMPGTKVAELQQNTC